MTPPADQRERDATTGILERVLVSLLALGTVDALFLLRSADDNRLTSWQWAFDGVNPLRLQALVAAGIVLANLAARLPFPPRRPGTVLFLSSYAVAACFWGEPEVVVDVARYFTQAKHLEVYGLRHFLAQWGTGISAWTDLPLVPLLYGLLFKLLGECRIYVQAFTTLLFAASVVLTYRVGKALWNDEVGFMGGALLLGIPYLLTQVPSMLVDVPTMFFLALALLAVIEALRHGGTARILLASLAVFLAFFSKYSAWLMLSVLPVTWAVHRRDGRRPAHTGALVALISGALVVAAVLWRHEVFSRQIALLAGYQAPGLRRWGESFVSTFLFQVHPFLTIAALASIWIAIRRREPKVLIIAWPMLLIVALQVRRARYAIPAFPTFALMAAYGLQAIRSRDARKLVVTCTVASSLVAALYGFLPFLRSTSAANLKMAGEYLDSIDEERVEVFTRPGTDSEVNPAISVPILDLFTTKKLIYRDERAPPPPRAQLEESSLRFTWDYENPAYYAANGAEGNTAIAVISGGTDEPLPDHLAERLRGHRLARTFAAYEGVFQHRTLVDVYRAAPASHGDAQLR